MVLSLGGKLHSYIDLFGKSPQFLVNNKKTVPTLLGLIFSFGVYGISIGYCIYLFIEISSKKSPIVNTVNLKLKNPPPLHLNYTNFELLFSLADPNGYPYINESIYIPSLSLMTLTLNQEKVFVSTNIKLTNCGNRNFTKKIYENINHLDLTKYYCISDKQDIPWENIYLNEYWGTLNFKMLKLNIRECRSKEGCASEEVRKELLETARITIFNIDNMIETNNYKEFFLMRIQDDFLIVSNKFKNSVTRYLKHSIVNSPTPLGNWFSFLNGWLLNNIQNQSSYIFDELIVQNDNSIPKDKILLVYIRTFE